SRFPTLFPYTTLFRSNVFALAGLSQAYALKGEKASALTIAERAMMLLPRAKDRVSGPTLEENLALIQTIVGENSRAISVLAQLRSEEHTSELQSLAYL